MGLLGHLHGVEGWKYAAGAAPHVVAVTPQVLRPVRDQDRVVDLQVQLVLVTGDKPERGQETGSRGGSTMCVSVC